MLGSGVLTLPQLFSQTGWVLGLAGLSVVALVSYITATFVVETIFIYRLLQQHYQDQGQNKAGTQADGCVMNVNSDKGALYSRTDCNNENIVENLHIDHVNDKHGEVKKEKYEMNEPRKNMCNIGRDEEVELGHLFQMFFPNFLSILFYITLCLQLYGVISIDFVILSKSLTSISCDEYNWVTVNTTTSCKNMVHLPVHEVYLVMLSIFVALIGPFVFFDIASTKVIQLLTFIYRFVSLLCMSILGMMKIGNGSNVTPKLASLGKLPNFVGAVLYILGFHMAIPSIINPIKYKHSLKSVIITPFVIVMVLDVLLVMSACYAYPVEEIQDIYTLNFTHPPPLLKYFLQLFPVVCLLSSVPITAIVLRENLKKLLLKKNEEEYSFMVRRIAFPLLVLIPPVTIAYVTDDVILLVGYIGTGTGGLLLYVFPALSVHFARRTAERTLGSHYSVDNKSSFCHKVWIMFILVWYVISTATLVFCMATS